MTIHAPPPDARGVRPQGAVGARSGGGCPGGLGPGITRDTGVGRGLRTQGTGGPGLSLRLRFLAKLAVGR